MVHLTDIEPKAMSNNKREGVVRLASYHTAAEAEVAASMLRSMGIGVSVVNEVSTIMLPYINDNLVWLLVAEEELEQALALLQAPHEEEE